MKPIALKPRVSEKSYAISELTNTYVFDVPAEANKHDIARAVASQFEVKVVSVRISNVAGKPKRTVRRGRVAGQSKRTDIRKAYVTLLEGNKLPIFAAVEEANAKEEAVQEKVEKAAAKQIEKNDKVAEKVAHKGGLHLPGRRGSRGGDK